MKLTMLQQIRKQKGYSQEELGHRARLSHSTIYRIEAGGECGKNTANRIADAMKVKLELLTGEQP